LLAPIPSSRGEVVYPPGGTLGPRWATLYEFVLIHTGCMTVWVDDIPLYAPANSLTLLFPGHEQRFEFAKAGATFHTWVHFVVPDLPATLAVALERLPPVIPLSPAFHSCMSQLLRLRSSPLSTSDEIARVVTAQMFWLYIGEAEQVALWAGLKRGQQQVVEAAQEFILLHLAEPLTLGRIAQAVAMSPAHLIRLFRIHLGLTPLTYVWQQRVERGVALLEQTGLTVEQIAEQCGFKTSYHFSRRVKNATGQTPRHIRRHSWLNSEASQLTPIIPRSV